MIDETEKRRVYPTSLSCYAKKAEPRAQSRFNTAVQYMLAVDVFNYAGRQKCHFIPEIAFPTVCAVR